MISDFVGIIFDTPTPQKSDILYACSLKTKCHIFYWWDSLPASFNFNDSVSTCKLPILPLLAAFSRAFSTLMALAVSPLASQSPLSTITTISATNSPKLLLEKNQSIKDLNLKWIHKDYRAVAGSEYLGVLVSFGWHNSLPPWLR